MTGKIRHSLGLLVAAVIAALAGLLLGATGIPQMEDVGGFMLLGAGLLVVVGLVRIAGDLLRSPQSD